MIPIIKYYNERNLKKFQMKVCHVGRKRNSRQNERNSRQNESLSGQASIRSCATKKQKDNSFSTTVPLFSFSPSNLQTHDQIFAAQFHSVHHHDYQPKHKRP